MASTRDLLVYILRNSPKIRDWCEKKHGFTLAKAQTGDIPQYGDFAAEVIQDGIKEGVITAAQAKGDQALPA
jgi:hypothetical protein